ncbi:MAG: hypothetical protein HYV28_03485 [Ignavibacteriales bacterium]|nr:hypothetical protein [Ignavibacteriales bacterium]
MKRLLFYVFVGCCLALTTNAQQGQGLITVDQTGVIRWSDTNIPAYFFGVNYAAPFAFSYRALKAKNISGCTANETAWR